MKTKQNEPVAVWIIVIIVMILIAGLIFFDIKVMNAYKAHSKARQDSINTSQYYPDTLTDEDTTFMEDPADTNRAELRREYLRDTVR